MPTEPQTNAAPCPWGHADADWCHKFHDHTPPTRPRRRGAGQPPTEAQRAEVLRQAADLDLYKTRLGYRGGRELYDRITTSIAPGVFEKQHAWHRLVRGRDGKWRLMDVRNGVHRATAAVHEGAAKALATDSLPETITLAWWYQVDQNAQRDMRRAEATERAARGALTAAATAEERAALPARPADVEAKQSGADDAEPRFLPPADSIHSRLPQPDEHLEAQQEHRQEQAAVEREAAEAKARLEGWRKAVRLDSRTYELLIQYLGRGVSLRKIGETRRPPTSHKKISRMLGPAIDLLTLRSGLSGGRLAAEFKKAYGSKDLTITSPRRHERNQTPRVPRQQAPNV